MKATHTRPKTYVQIITLVITLLINNLLFATEWSKGSPQYAMSESGVVEEAVIIASATQGHVKVIVGFRPAATNSITGTKTEVEDAGKAIIKRISSNELVFSKRLKNFGLFYAEVSDQGIEELIADSRVLFVTLDTPVDDFRVEGNEISGITPIINMGYDGSGVNIAIIDRGYTRSHDELQNLNVTEHCFESPNGCPNGAGEMHGIGSAVDTSQRGHGTWMTGIAASSIPNANYTIIRTNEEWDRLDAFDWLVDQIESNVLHIDVLNMSFGIRRFGPHSGDCSCYGGPSCNSDQFMWSPFIDRMASLGVTMVAATGNTYNKSQIHIPSCMDDVIAVGAAWDSEQESVTIGSCTDNNTYIRMEACYSDKSPVMDVFATGSIIRSTDSAGSSSYESQHGTSQASMFVSSCAALLIEATGASPTELREALRGSPYMENGFPVVDCEAALAWLENDRADLSVNSSVNPNDSCHVSFEIANAGERTVDSLSYSFSIASVSVIQTEFIENLPGNCIIDTNQGNTIGSFSSWNCTIENMRVGSSSTFELRVNSTDLGLGPNTTMTTNIISSNKFDP